jgi:hypothetical protein
MRRAVHRDHPAARDDDFAGFDSADDDRLIGKLIGRYGFGHVPTDPMLGWCAQHAFDGRRDPLDHALAEIRHDVAGVLGQ